MDNNGITNYVNGGPRIDWEKVHRLSEEISRVCAGSTASEAALAYHQFMIKQTLRAATEGIHDNANH
jgi:hypothetical protein